MSSSKEEDFSDDDLVNVFGESEDEDDFVGFNFTLPDDIHWETRRLVNFMMTILARYFAATMLVQQSKNYLVRSDLWILSSSLSAMNFWKKIARWTNDWFQVKKASEPNKHKAPFEPITDINELKAFLQWIKITLSGSFCLERQQASALFIHCTLSWWSCNCPASTKGTA